MRTRHPGARPRARGGRCGRRRFPPRSTVYNSFRKFQRDGVWEAIWAELHIALRERMGREASPSAAVLDSPIDQIRRKRGGNDNEVGYDAGKRIKGREIRVRGQESSAYRSK